MGKVEKSVKAFIAPRKYIQGPKEINNLKIITETLGKSPLILIDGFLFNEFSEKMATIFKKNVTCHEFKGQVSMENTNYYTDRAKETDCDLIIGMGGGKTIDAAKVVANNLSLPLIIVPTSASTDAPTSALSVIYTETGEHSHEIFYDRAPEVVLIDTEIISKAPVRLLVAGMGDALATYFEARACKESDSFNNIKGNYKRTITSYAIAKACYETLLEDGLKAKLAAEAGANTIALENIIEVNTLLSGIGAESNGASGAHAFHDGFTAIEESKDKLHGEKVAFGVLCQLALENRDKHEIETVIKFSKSVGLPVTLEDLGVIEVTVEKLRAAARAVMHSPLILREPFDVTEDMIFSAILSADSLGKMYKD